MYAFLLTLGAVMIAGGLGLIASGFSFSQRAFDATNVTPGIVAITGGCILLGLAFVVRALLRVEQALRLRPMTRPASLGEVVGLAAPAAQAPLPVKPKGAPPPMPVPADAAAGAQAPPPAVRIPALENAPVVEDSGVSLLPNGSLRAEDESVQMNYAAAAPRLNGTGHAKAVQRVAVSAAPAPRRPPPPQQQKGSLFDSFWPKAQRGSPQASAAAVQVVPPPPAAMPPALEAAPQVMEPSPVPAAQEAAAAAAVSILKSGVVEGMAYTLYSDGSIEAQLPGGMLRFRSITELRNHIEQNS
jgi:hypothetical protein